MISLNIQNIIAKMDLWKLVRIAPFVFALHELEEWNILAWHKKYQTNVPDVTDIHLRTFFLVLIGIAFIYFYIAQRIRNKKTAAKILIPFLFLMIYNGLVHFYWVIYFSTYFPGFIFGFIISVPLAGIIIYKIITEKLVPALYVSFFGLFFTIILINAIVNVEKLEPVIANSMLVGKFLSEWIWF